MFQSYCLNFVGYNQTYQISKLTSIVTIVSINVRKNPESTILATLNQTLYMDKSALLFELTPVPYFILSADGVITEVNSKGVELLGLSKKQLIINKSFAQFILKQDAERLTMCRANLLLNKQNQTCDARLFKSNGSIISARLNWSIIDRLDKQEILLVAYDITFYKQLEETQNFLLRNNWPAEDKDFFHALTRYLSEVLEADYVCIEQLHNTTLEAETLAVYYDGHFEDNVRYSLLDTPCGKVAGNPVCTFPQSVRFLFPSDQVLQDIQAESYTGITLWGSNGQAIGLIAAISRRRMEDTLVAETVLKQVSVRASAELEFLILKKKLHRTYNALEKSSQLLSGTSDEETLLNEACRIIREDCGFALVWIGFAEHDEKKRIIPVAYSGIEEGYLEQLKLTWDDSDRGNGPSGMAIKTGKVTISRNILKDPAFKPWREEAIKRGFASSIVFPLSSEGRVFGQIAIYSRDPDPFQSDEISLLTNLANDLAQGITSIRLRKAKEEAEKALSHRSEEQ